MNYEYAISPYGIFFVTSLVVSFLIVTILLVKKNVPRRMIGYSVFLNIILTLYGAKMYSVIISGFKVSLWEAGFASLGGVSGLLAGIYIFGLIYKEGRQIFLEAYAVVIPLMYGIAKIGCSLAGCCHGIPYSGVFAVTYENRVVQGGPYFPIQMLESIVFILIFLVGILLYWKGHSNYIAPIIIILCAVAKFSLDFLREEHIGKLLSVNQAICIGFFVWGTTLLFKKRGRRYV